MLFFVNRKRVKVLVDTNRNRGRAGISLAIAYYGSNGYSVSIPLNDTQWYDLVIEKDGIFQTVQCKCTTSKNGSIQFRSCGGTNGGVYDNILEHPLDLLFCVNGETKDIYSIPMIDIKESSNHHSIRLRTTKNQNNQGFNTCDYLVHL